MTPVIQDGDRLIYVVRKDNAVVPWWPSVPIAFILCRWDLLVVILAGIVLIGCSLVGATTNGATRTSLSVGAPTSQLPRSMALRYMDPLTVEAVVPSAKPAPPSVESQIRLAARHFGVDENMLVAVARCESGLRVDAFNASSGASGPLQFIRSTWDANAIRYWGYSVGDMRKDPLASATLASWMISRGQLHQWECARILGYA